MPDEVTVTVAEGESASTETPEVVVVAPASEGGDTATLADLASRIGALEARLDQTNEDVQEAQTTADIAEIVAEGASTTAVEAVIMAEEAEQTAEVAEVVATTEPETSETAPIEDDTSPAKVHWFDRRWTWGRRND
jgi:hypothetical protein